MAIVKNYFTFELKMPVSAHLYNKQIKLYLCWIIDEVHMTAHRDVSDEPF